MRSMKEKIAALRAKTRGAGCTEAEALAAAELAARLMREHNLSEADIVMEEAVAREPTVKPTWRATVATVIAYCTNTASIVLIDRRQGAAILFVGRAPGPKIALYLRDVCFRAVATELKAFKSGRFYRGRRSLATRRQASADFVEGMVTRLCGRLIELFGPSSDDRARDEAHAIVEQRFAGAVAHRKPGRETRYSQAAAEGWTAGGDVALHRGVDATAPLRLSRTAS